MKKYNIKNPFLTKIIRRDLISKKGSVKNTYHIVLDIAESNIVYKTGDSVAILPENCPILVEKTIQALRSKEDTLIIDPRSKVKMSLKNFLTKKIDIRKIPLSLLHILSKENPKLKPLLEDSNSLTQCELWDVFKDFHYTTSLQSICNELIPLSYRFYSIASSQKDNPNEIHIIVVEVTYFSNNDERKGVTSHFLCSRAKENETQIPIYIHNSKYFTLPQDPNVPIIMIGPGTGIAPFRSFLHDRLAINANGKNWLFFGECNRSTDFYFEDFITKLTKTKFLKLNTAFSRDQKEKIYVQHKILENSKELWQWIKEGSFIFICGASSMAKEVEKALILVVSKEDNISYSDAQRYLSNLRKEKRYVKDVY